MALKESRETNIWLKVVVRARMIQPTERIGPLLQETDELIAIVSSSIETAKKNQANEP